MQFVVFVRAQPCRKQEQVYIFTLGLSTELPQETRNFLPSQNPSDPPILPQAMIHYLLGMQQQLR